MEINEKNLQELGQNIKYMHIDGDKLVIVIDTVQTIGLSSTGKMMGIASTNGFVQMASGMKLNLWLGKKP